MLRYHTIKLIHIQLRTGRKQYSYPTLCCRLLGPLFEGNCLVTHQNQSMIAPSAYRWYVLALATFTFTLVVAIPTMALPVLFKEIADDLGLNLVQLGTIWGIGALSGLFAGLIGGSLGDRFGANRILTIACFLAGVAGALRGFGHNFTTLAATMLIFGFIIPMIPMNVHKICGIWFSGRHLGLANGVVSGGMAFGFMIGSLISATIVSPWLGGWRNTLFFYGAIAIVISIPWAFTRSGPAGVAASGQAAPASSMRQTFLQVVRLRNIWLFGLAILGVNGCVQGVLGYLPLYLREIGWPLTQADGALATFHALSLMGVIPIVILSDWTGQRKSVLAAATIAIAFGVGLLTVSQGVIVWLAVMIAGVFRDGFMAIFFTSVIETKGVGAVYAGTATGFTLIFLQIGNLLAPPIGNSLATLNPSLPFAFWAGLAVLGLICFYFIKEPSSQTNLPAIDPHESQFTEAS